MATGYTMDITKGIDFRTFALKCARGMGALIHMRDDALDVPIREDKVSGYHAEELEKREAELQRVHSLTVEECEQEAEKLYLHEVEYRDKQEKERLELLKKYEDMLEQVRAWSPPTSEHAGMKEFMETQIVDSIKFDCRVCSSDEPVKKDGASWRADKISRIMKDIEYSKKHGKEDQERVAERNKWVKDLIESLPAESVDED